MTSLMLPDYPLGLGSVGSQNGGPHCSAVPLQKSLGSEFKIAVGDSGAAPVAVWELHSMWNLCSPFTQNQLGTVLQPSRVTFVTRACVVNADSCFPRYPGFPHTQLRVPGLGFMGEVSRESTAVPSSVAAGNSVQPYGPGPVSGMMNLQR